MLSVFTTRSCSVSEPPCMASVSVLNQKDSNFLLNLTVILVRSISHLTSFPSTPFRSRTNQGLRGLVQARRESTCWWRLWSGAYYHALSWSGQHPKGQLVPERPEASDSVGGEGNLWVWTGSRAEDAGIERNGQHQNESTTMNYSMKL